MQILSAFIFAFIGDIDTLVIGLSYGIKKIKLTSFSILIISILPTIGTFISMKLGKSIIKFIPESLTNFIGSVILILIGLYPLLEPYIIKLKNKYYKNKNEYVSVLKNPEKFDEDDSGCIDMKETIPLAIALTINNLAIGVGAGIANISVLLTTLFTFILNIVNLILGYVLGDKCLSILFGNFAKIFSCLIIIFLGIYRLI